MPASRRAGESAEAYAQRTAREAQEEFDAQDNARIARERNDRASGGGDGSGGGETFDSVSADIPIWGWLSGAEAREGERSAATEAERNRAMWESLGQGAPSVEQLTTDYGRERNRDEYGNLLGDPSQLTGMPASQQRDALGQISASQAALSELMRGGMTAADRQALTAQRLQQGQQLRGANQAAIQQMGARGMGGGGAELAARLGGSQSYANASAMGDAAIMGGAQQRALQAMQSHGSLGAAYGGIAGQMNAQEMQRRQAIDAYNQANYGWRRGRESRNTAWGNQGRESASQAQQQAFENRARTVTGASGHNPYGAGAEDRRRQDEASQAGAGVIGSIIDEIL